MAFTTLAHARQHSLCRGQQTKEVNIKLVTRLSQAGLFHCPFQTISGIIDQHVNRANFLLNEAAALPVAYGTAHRMLITHNTIKAGDKVLILGASGGVGTACVVLAKHLGAEVIACAGSDEKGAALAALGADHVVNYHQQDFSRWAIDKYGKPQRRSVEGGVDVVINFTGGDTWRPSLKCLKRGGILLVCGATAGYDPQEDLRYIWSFELTIKGSNSFYEENLTALLEMIARGEIDPLIDRVLPLEQAAEGLRLIRDREVLGKVLRPHVWWRYRCPVRGRPSNRRLRRY